MTKRQIALLRRRLFLSFSGLFLVAIIFFAGFFTNDIFFSDPVKEDISSDSEENKSDVESNLSDSDVQSSTDGEDNFISEEPVIIGEYKLDANFGNLLLVNGENPLPDSYDSDVRQHLVEIDKQYRNNNNVTQIHKDVYPYITAMVATAQKDGVDLRVWSPFRSYAIQNDLFQKQVARVGGDEAKAATVVARPGTSEHNTGLCADFNMASDAFEKTKMYAWMTENAENFGFVMRYRKDKQPITGVIHESWHWRFVGINHAKKMNELDMCLEEYVEYLESEKANKNKAKKIKDN